jgi:putative ABC transport system permease protein
MTRLIETTLYGISFNDPVTISSNLMILIGVALVASLIPAIRAARVNPIAALRNDQ